MNADGHRGPESVEAEAPEGGAGFPVARCATCDRVVLTHVVLDGAAEPRRRCIACDADVDATAVEWVDESALGRIGYALHDDAAGGCGRPGCGRGNCANRR